MRHCMVTNVLLRIAIALEHAGMQGFGGVAIVELTASGVSSMSLTYAVAASRD
jgi:hypothetical protein